MSAPDTHRRDAQEPRHMVYAGRSRLDETLAREGDIPAYFAWSDGSEYSVGAMPGHTGIWRQYHGPKFGRALGDWHTEFVCEESEL